MKTIDTIINTNSGINSSSSTSTDLGFDRKSFAELRKCMALKSGN